MADQVDFLWIQKLTTIIKSGNDYRLPELQHYSLGAGFEGTYRFTLVRPSVRPSVLPSVTDYLGNRLMKFSEIWYVDAF